MTKQYCTYTPGCSSHSVFNISNNTIATLAVSIISSSLRQCCVLLGEGSCVGAGGGQGGGSSAGTRKRAARCLEPSADLCQCPHAGTCTLYGLYGKVAAYLSVTVQYCATFNLVQLLAVPCAQAAQTAWLACL